MTTLNSAAHVVSTHVLVTTLLVGFHRREHRPSWVPPPGLSLCLENEGGGSDCLEQVFLLQHSVILLKVDTEVHVLKEIIF